MENKQYKSMIIVDLNVIQHIAQQVNNIVRTRRQWKYSHGQFVQLDIRDWTWTLWNYNHISFF